MFSRVTCLAACLLLSSTALAQSPGNDQGAGDAPDPRVAEAYRGYHARVAVALAEEGTPRGLAIAALMLRLADGTAAGAAPDDDTPSQEAPVDPRSDQWRQRALATAGNDALAVALVAASSDTGSGADAVVRRDALARWLSVEPDNLAPLLVAGGAVSSLLQSASGTRRFDLHYLDFTRAIAAALVAHPPTAAERAVLQPDADAPAPEVATASASGMAAAFGLPSFRPLFDACRGPALDASPLRAGECGHVARVMREQSDTVLGESIGLSLARSMATSPEAAAAVDAQGRRFAWRTQRMGEVTIAQPRDGMTDFVRMLADPSLRSERQIAERVLAGAGVPLEPPADWQPPRRN